MAKSIAPFVDDDDDDELVIEIVPMKDSDGGSAKPVRRHITSSFSKEELADLKKQDPFLYYSIPGIHTGTGAVSSDKSTDLPSLSGSQSSITLQRRSCVSVECDVLHEMLEDYEKNVQSSRRRRPDKVRPRTL